MDQLFDVIEAAELFVAPHPGGKALEGSVGAGPRRLVAYKTIHRRGVRPVRLHGDNGEAVPLKNGVKVRLYSRPGNNLTYRFPLIVETIARLRPRSCIIDGEAVVCDSNGMVSFDHIRYRRHDSGAFLYAFDLIEVNGDDLRRDPLEVRKAVLANIVAKAGHGV